MLCWVLVSVLGLPPAVASGGHSSSRCAGLSLSRPSLVAEHKLQTRRLSSCGSRAQPLRGMWDPPRPELEPVSPALAGRLSTTAPPGKPLGPSLASGQAYAPSPFATTVILLCRCIITTGPILPPDCRLPESRLHPSCLLL